MPKNPSLSRQALSFGDLLAPITFEEFTSRFFEKRHLFVHRDNPEFYADLHFGFEDVDDCIESARTSSEKSVKTIAATGSDRKTKRYHPGEIQVDELYRSFHLGDSVGIVGVHKLWPSLSRLAASTHKRLNAKININAYMTPKGSQAFQVHYDQHEVIVLQTDGSKEWYVYEPRYELPIGDVLDYKHCLEGDFAISGNNAKLIDKAVLNKGDLLYLPRGFYHKAVATDQPSLHLTIGVSPVYWVDFFKAALEAASVDQLDLRRAVPMGFAEDTEIANTAAKEFHSILRSFCDQASFDETLEVVRKSEVMAGQFPPDGHFRQLAYPAELADETLVERRPGVTCCVEISGMQATILFAQSGMKGPSTLGPALEFIRDHHRFRLAELPGSLDEQSRAVLVRRLIREGLIRVIEERA